VIARPRSITSATVNRCGRNGPSDRSRQGSDYLGRGHDRPRPRQGHPIKGGDPSVATTRGSLVICRAISWPISLPISPRVVLGTPQVAHKHHDGRNDQNRASHSSTPWKQWEESDKANLQHARGSEGKNIEKTLTVVVKVTARSFALRDRLTLRRDQSLSNERGALRGWAGPTTQSSIVSCISRSRLPGHQKISLNSTLLFDII
jgi:hypothetical protein